jgi:threonine dehydratase
MKETTSLVAKEAIESAARRVSSVLSPTPCVRAHYLSKKFGREIYLKLEILQPTNSFKVRGAFNCILSLPESRRQAGIVTASGGNHGLGVALVASRLDIPCTIYLPVKTAKIKLDAIAALGAKTVLVGQAWDDANKVAIESAAANGSAYIHPFDDPLVMAGQGTIVTEVIEQIGSFDRIVLSIGGGGLISGVSSAVKHFLPRAKVIGVETEGANCMSASLKAGRIVELPAITSIADTLGAKRTQEMQFAIVKEAVEKVIEVSDEAAIGALIELLQHEKILAEPASTCSIAALEQMKSEFAADERIVVVICGANIDLNKVCAWISERRSP